MSIGLIGKKQGMTRVFTPEGESFAVSVVSVLPNIITQIKSEEKEGYSSIQVTTGQKKDKHLTKSLQGHFKKNSLVAGEGLWEFRVQSEDQMSLVLETRLILKFLRKVKISTFKAKVKERGICWNCQEMEFQNARCLSRKLNFS